MAIPSSWVEVPISEVCELNPKKETNDLPLDAVVTFVPMPAVSAESGTIENPQKRPLSQVNKGFTAFQNDDVLMAKITPCMENGKAAIARDLENGLGFGSTEFHVLRTSEAILPEYVFYFIRQESFRKMAEKEMTGSVGQKRVPKIFFDEKSIPLAPLNEQRRIVEKLDEVMGRLAAAREKLERVPRLLAHFRRAVLSAACSGTLTRDWREENEKDAADEYLLIDSQGSEENVTWLISPLGNLYSMQNGRAMTAKMQKPGNIRVFGGNGQSGLHSEFNFDGTGIIVGRVGALCGNVHQVEGQIWVSDNAIALKPQLNIDNTFFAFVLTNANLNSLSGGTGQPYVSQQILQSLVVPLPPFAEQIEIARRVNKLFTLADSLEARHAKAKVFFDRLPAAILAKAFRGELVPQDPDDESAEQLLERLRAGQSEAPKKGRQRVAGGEVAKKGRKAVASAGLTLF